MFHLNPTLWQVVNTQKDKLGKISKCCCDFSPCPRASVRILIAAIATGCSKILYSVVLSQITSLGSFQAISISGPILAMQIQNLHFNLHFSWLSPMHNKV
jgi:hypothetical protein